MNFAETAIGYNRTSDFVFHDSLITNTQKAWPNKIGK